MSDSREDIRVSLLCELRQGRTMCLVASDLLEILGEEGALEGSLSREDILYGLSGIVRSVARTLEAAEHRIGALE